MDAGSIGAPEPFPVISLASRAVGQGGGEYAHQAAHKPPPAALFAEC
jgi:hypothetical protein